MYNVPITTSPLLPERSLFVIQRLWFNMSFGGETEGRANSESRFLHQPLKLSLRRMPAEWGWLSLMPLLTLQWKFRQPFVVVSVGLARLLRESTLSLGNFWLLRVVARYCGVGPALSAQAADKARECCKQVSTVNWRPAKSQIDPPWIQVKRCT